jgi:hypothetical protein
MPVVLGLFPTLRSYEMLSQWLLAVKVARNVAQWHISDMGFCDAIPPASP